MNHFYRGVILSVGLALMVGCQTQRSMHFFKLQPTDTSITTAVHENLLHNEGLSSLNVRVVTHQRVVTLSGYVKTIRQSDTAEDIARKTEGVQSVQNDIVVRK